MRKIAIINQKGGVGKTTTTANLGVALSQHGCRVLLLDLDPQGHLTLHLGVELKDNQPTVYDILTSGTPVRETIVKARKNIGVIPTNVDLAAAEAELISVTGREVILREALAAVEGEYDIMLVDCPPSLGVLTINALSACDEVLIPLQPHFLALQGLGKLLETITLVRQRINSKLRVEGVVICMNEAGTKLATEVTDDLAKFLVSARGTDTVWADAKIHRTAIRRNIKLAEACSFGQTIFEYAPKSNGALDYSSLAQELLGIAAIPFTTEQVAAPATPTPMPAAATPVPPAVLAPVPLAASA
ncbi:MAG: ParA family protein [Planctomycetes bacterium]|nr:ParA family protein [Planctomycetota bacterium]